MGICRDMPLKKLSKITERYEASPVDDELMLIDIDTGRFFALKDVALRIWTLLDSDDDLEAISEKLCSEYEVEPTEAREGVARFAESLVNAGFARYC